MSDQQFTLVEPNLPQARQTGRRRTIDLREVFEVILDLIRAPYQWRMPPKAFPLRSTVDRYFRRFGSKAYGASSG